MGKLQRQRLRQLVKNVQKGDMEAFSALYSETNQAQYFTALSILKDTALAEEVIAMTYCQVLQNISTLSDPAGFLAWISKILFNNCMDILKKERKLGPELTPDFPVEMIDLHTETDPAGRAILSENQRIIMDMLGELSEVHRNVIILRYFHHLKIREIAAVTCVSEGTVRSRIHYALLKLKKLFHNRGYFSTDSLLGVGVTLGRAFEGSALPSFRPLKLSARQTAFCAACLLLLGAGLSTSEKSPSAAADTIPPSLQLVEKTPEGLLIKPEDDSSGVDYDNIKAVRDDTGQPLKLSKDKPGQILVELLDYDALSLTVSDMAGNKGIFRLSCRKESSF